MGLINEYLDKEFYACPECGSDQIEAVRLGHDLYQRTVTCESCGFVWQEHFAVIANFTLDGKELPNPP